MPPQQPQNQPESPAPAGNSDPNYNFIFNDQQKPKRRFGLPGGGNLAKVTFLIIGGGAILGVLIIVLSSVFGAKGIDSKQLIDVAARSLEIIRVSDTVSHESRDVNTMNLAATTSTTLTSEQTDIILFLKKNRTKVFTKDLNTYLNKKTDAELQSAAQNNTLSEYYGSYLKKNLTDYQTALNTIHNSTSSAKLKAATQNYYSSTHVILSTPQLATAQ